MSALCCGSGSVVARVARALADGDAIALTFLPPSNSESSTPIASAIAATSRNVGSNEPRSTRLMDSSATPAAAATLACVNPARSRAAFSRRPNSYRSIPPMGRNQHGRRTKNRAYVLLTYTFCWGLLHANLRRGPSMRLSLTAFLVAALTSFGCGGVYEPGGSGGSGGAGGSGGTGGAGGSGGAGGGGGASCSAANCTGCCFNNTCQGGNTSAGCGKNGQACASCSSAQICKTDQTCGVDPESTWKVQPVSATIASTNGGATWDGASSPPDAFLHVWCPATASVASSVTPTISDTYTPTWSTGGCTAKAKDLINPGFAFAMWDEDTLADDVIITKSTVTVSETNFQNGGGMLSVNGTSVSFQFTKQ